MLDFDKISKWARVEECAPGAIGYGKKRLTMCSVLQFMEDQSDRESARFLGENIAGKWFAGFALTEKTPDYRTICKFRNAIGCKQLSKIFAEVKYQLQGKGYAAELFTFADATALTRKLTMWEERGKSIQDGYEKFNNEVLKKYAKGKDVRISSKNVKKFWIGYKKHVAVDAQSGMITKVALTRANVTDAAGAKHVLPSSGAVLGDKGYVGAISAIKAKGLHPVVVLKNNMNAKNHDLDRWITKLRSPYERTFSKQNQRTRYEGIATTFDGYPMAKNGQPSKALGLGICASIFGGLFSFLALYLIAPQRTKVALQFGEFEFFALTFFALTLVSVLLQGQPLKGII